jgi:hypothetical protein
MTLKWIELNGETQRCGEEGSPVDEKGIGRK